MLYTDLLVASDENVAAVLIAVQQVQNQLQQMQDQSQQMQDQMQQMHDELRSLSRQNGKERTSQCIHLKHADLYCYRL